jgi:phosphoglycerate dehydrogenase-like enzyme
MLGASIGRLGQVPESENGGSQTALRVGDIGLGDMGGGLATSLVRAGMPVSVCDVRVDLPPATLAERRCGRIYGFEGDI